MFIIKNDKYHRHYYNNTTTSNNITTTTTTSITKNTSSAATTTAESFLCVVKWNHLIAKEQSSAWISAWLRLHKMYSKGYPKRFISLVG